jgi:glutathione S-transferase
MRVRMALHEKQIPFSIREEDLKALSPELKALHPEGRVPLLVHGPAVVYESAIIAEYVDDLAPAVNPLMPDSAAERAECRLWTYWCNHAFKPDLDRFKYGSNRFPISECEGVDDRVVGHLVKLERRLAVHSWLVGNQFSLADINVFPFFRQLTRIQPTPGFLTKFVGTQLWLNRICDRPSFALTMAKG